MTKIDWNTDQEGNSGYPALDWEDSPPVRNTPSIESRKIPDENNRQPNVKFRIGKNRR